MNINTTITDYKVVSDSYIRREVCQTKGSFQDEIYSREGFSCCFLISLESSVPANTEPTCFLFLSINEKEALMQTFRNTSVHLCNFQSQGCQVWRYNMCTFNDALGVVSFILQEIGSSSVRLSFYMLFLLGNDLIVITFV